VAYASIPSFAVVSGFSSRVWLRASWRFLSPAHSWSSRVFSFGSAVFSFSGVFFSFFRKSRSGVMVVCLCLVGIKVLLRCGGEKSFMIEG